MVSPGLDKKTAKLKRCSQCSAFKILHKLHQANKDFCMINIYSKFCNPSKHLGVKHGRVLTFLLLQQLCTSA